jgi:hypothetical protein
MKCEPGTDSAGCCWWGRGPTQLTGVHNIKIFNIWLTDNSDILGTIQDENKVATSLCTNPGLICRTNSKTSNGFSIVWLSSFSYWIFSVQESQYYFPQFQKYMKLLDKTNNKFPVQETTDLNKDSPASWPNGVGCQISGGKWCNGAARSDDRLCGFIRMLKKLDLMPNNPAHPAPWVAASDCKLPSGGRGSNCPSFSLCCATAAGLPGTCVNTSSAACSDVPPSPTSQLAPICNLNVITYSEKMIHVI